MKKLYMTVLTLITLTLALSGCVDIKVTEKSGTTKVIDKNINFTVTTETNPKFLEEPKDEELRFFDSVNNAIKGSRIEDYTADCFSSSNIIKIIEKDKDVLIFILQSREQKDCINTFKLRKKIENNKARYSEPIYAVGFAWKVVEWWIDGIVKRVDESEVLKYTVASDLGANNPLGSYNLDDQKYKVQWGYTDDPNIKNLTINGQKPTEIIELKMDGDDVYFWYYENLEVDYDNIMDMEILY